LLRAVEHALIRYGTNVLREHRHRPEPSHPYMIDYEPLSFRPSPIYTSPAGDTAAEAGPDDGGIQGICDGALKSPGTITAMALRFAAVADELGTRILGDTSEDVLELACASSWEQRGK